MKAHVFEGAIVKAQVSEGATVKAHVFEGAVVKAQVSEGAIVKAHKAHVLKVL